MKIITILGARPQFIKAGTVSREFQKHKNIQEIIIHTGQHYDANMSDIFFKEMKIPTPDYKLGIGGKSHGAMTGLMVEKIEEICLKECPDWVLVYGDTNSTLAGALVASKSHIKLAHIEAGLRSFNLKMPEEVNRILTDRVSNLLFCPTEIASQNLKKENLESISPSEIVMCGDVMQDGALFYKELSRKPNWIKEDESYILCTIHRAENTDQPSRLKSIFDALESISEKKKIILPLHPRTRKVLEEMGSLRVVKNVKIIDPVGYLEMVWLINNCELILTDSGGLQKEAYFFRKPCITLRDETEWVELLSNRYNVLVGSDTSAIIKAFNEFEFNKNYDLNLYGDGKASKIIVEKLLENHGHK